MEVNYKQMLLKLDELYTKQESIQKHLTATLIALEQINGEIELLQTMIMHKSNTEYRKKKIWSWKDAKRKE
jgi:hypothetical protein